MGMKKWLNKYVDYVEIILTFNRYEQMGPIGSAIIFCSRSWLFLSSRHLNVLIRVKPQIQAFTIILILLTRHDISGCNQKHWLTSHQSYWLNGKNFYSQHTSAKNVSITGGDYLRQVWKQMESLHQEKLSLSVSGSRKSTLYATRSMWHLSSQITTYMYYSDGHFLPASPSLSQA